MDPRVDEVIRAVTEGIRAGSISRDDARNLIGEMVLDWSEGAGAWQSRWRARLAEFGVPADALDTRSGTLRGRSVASGQMAARVHGGDEVAAVVGHAAVLGDPSTWEAPVEYPSTALAVIDSIWSIGVRYQGVRNVIHRYRELRQAQGADADRDTPADLVNVIERLGGPEAFAEAVRNRQRTSARSGILKADAVLMAARHLGEEGIAAPEDIVQAEPEVLDAVRARWVSVPGQASGLSLDYFLMLSGLSGVKADRMIRRFVAVALGLPNELAISAVDAGALVRLAAHRLQIEERVFDYAIWRFESGQ